LELNSLALADISSAAVDKLTRNHARLFKCLKVDVAKALDWTKSDVRLNNGIFLDDKGEIPHEMKDLESKLLNKRSFSEVSWFL